MNDHQSSASDPSKDPAECNSKQPDRPGWIKLYGSVMRADPDLTRCGKAAYGFLIDFLSLTWIADPIGGRLEVPDGIEDERFLRVVFREFGYEYDFSAELRALKDAGIIGRDSDGKLTCLRMYADYGDGR